MPIQIRQEVANVLKHARLSTEEEKGKTSPANSEENRKRGRSWQDIRRQVGEESRGSQ